MGIRRYIGFSLLVIIIIGVATYTFEGGSYNFNKYGINLTLPIAVWVILPALLVALLSVLHLSFLYFNRKVFFRSLNKDYATFIKDTKLTFLGEKGNGVYKTDWFKMPGQILKLLDLKQNAPIENLHDDELQDLAKVVKDVREGAVKDLRAFRLSVENPLILKNDLNILDHDHQKAMEFLKSCPSLDSKLCKKAYDLVMDKASYADIKKLEFTLSKENIFKVFNRFANDEDALNLENEEVEELLRKIKFQKNDFIEIAKILKSKLEPDKLLDIFDKLHNENYEASGGYLFVLFELQMIDKAREFLINTDEKEFRKFKTLLFLRDNGKFADFDLFS